MLVTFSLRASTEQGDIVRPLVKWREHSATGQLWKRAAYCDLLHSGCMHRPSAILSHFYSRDEGKCSNARDHMNAHRKRASR
jgi:hypothetical protein